MVGSRGPMCTTRPAHTSLRAWYGLFESKWNISRDRYKMMGTVASIHGTPNSHLTHKIKLPINSNLDNTDSQLMCYIHIAQC